MKILVVEDEQNTARFLQRGLREEGFVVDVACNGEEADQAVSDHDYDAILLDVMLPGCDGFSLCRNWRARGVHTPILFVTARDALPDRIEGLNLGADDYLVKPFAFEELLARLRARLRRAETPTAAPAIQLGRLTVEPSARRAAGSPSAKPSKFSFTAASVIPVGARPISKTNNNTAHTEPTRLRLGGLCIAPLPEISLIIPLV